MITKRVFLWMFMVVLGVSSFTRADLMGYVATSASNSVVDLTNFDTGEQIPMGPSGVNNINSMEVSPIDGKIYAGGAYGFYEIDSSTGIGREISGHGISFYNLAFSPTGDLYGIAENSSDLYRIDELTGQYVSIGTNALFPYTAISAFAINDTGKGIGWDSSGWLFEIDLTDGSTTSLGQLTGYYNAFDYGPNGVLYAWRYDGSFYSIDIDIPEATLLRSFPFTGIGKYSFAIISPPYLKLISPNGDEKLVAGSNYLITWESQGNIAKVKLEYSPDNGGSWEVIDSSADNTGSYEWLVPEIDSGQCLLRVSDINNPDVFDTSDNVFSIMVMHEIYFNDFENHSDTLIEWSYVPDNNDIIDGNITPGTPQHPADRFLGQFGLQEDTTLLLNGLPTHSYVRVSFGLYILRSWDGSQPALPDIWNLTVSNGPTLMNTTFSNGFWPQAYPNEYPSVDNPSYTGADEICTLGYTHPSIGNDEPQDAVYNLTYIFPHLDNSIGLIFSAFLTEGLDPSGVWDESWGLDNIKVEIGQEPPNLILLIPNGNEELTAGTEQPITWDSSGEITNVKLEYSSDDGGNWNIIDPNTPNDGSYEWNVPYIDSQQCLVRITDVNAAGVTDVSDATFKISISKPILTSPNGGEQLRTGTNYPVQWNTVGIIDNILVEYSTNNGGNWSGVSPPNVGNMGSYDWAVPYELSDQCLIRVSDADYPAAFDVSNNVFEIVASYPKVTAPNGGEELLAATTYPVEWHTYGSIDEINIEYSLDNGGNWLPVSPANIGNAGSYDWLVPHVFSDECLVRVSDKDHASIQDTSDGVFRINALNLTSPDGGENILTGSTYEVEWEYSPLIARHDIKVEYSYTSGSLWETVAITENDGLYEWQVPTYEGLPTDKTNQFMIKITDVEDPNGWDQSRDTFKVYSCLVAIPGDVNGDCVVDIFDFCIVAQNWLVQGYIEFYLESLTMNPLWQTEGEWQFGEPQGLGGDNYGYPDPTSGYSGTNVYGVNLNGDYATTIGGPYYLTAGPFNCRHYSNIKLRFARWLNTDGSDYAEAKLEVSNNGISWISVWSNPGTPITEDSWNLVEYDIGSVADGEEALYIRWSYAILAQASSYAGWNIDDMGLWGNPK